MIAYTSLRYIRLFVAVVGVAFAALVLGHGAAEAGEKRCKGTKQFYAGKCRYADEIDRMKAEQQKRRQQEQAEAAQRAAQNREQSRAKDAQACVAARRANTKEAWQTYLNDHAEGLCSEEAGSAIAELEVQPEPEPEPEPALPEPQPEPEPEPEPAGNGLWLGQSPLVWIGFGVAGAGAITWAVAGGISLSRASDLEETCPNNLCAPADEADLDSANVAAHVTTVGVVVTFVGTAVGVTGLLLPLLSEDGGEADVEVAHVRLRPVVGLGGLGLEGTF